MLKPDESNKGCWVSNPDSERKAKSINHRWKGLVYLLTSIAIGYLLHLDILRTMTILEKKVFLGKTRMPYGCMGKHKCITTWDDNSAILCIRNVSLVTLAKLNSLTSLRIVKIKHDRFFTIFDIREALGVEL